jgi:integrase
MREGLSDTNPVIGTGRREEVSRSRVLNEDELRIVWNALLHDEFSSIVRLLILTGQRREEIGGLRWSELIDGKIILPSERTKNKRAHIIPLSEAAQAIIDAQRRRGDREYVFGRGAGGFSGWSRSKARLDVRIAEMIGHPLPGWTLHDIRRSCVTHMAELGCAPHIIEALINHVSGYKHGVHGIYNRSTYEREKRVALQTWTNNVLALVEKRESKIVTLRV